MNRYFRCGVRDVNRGKKGRQNEWNLRDETKASLHSVKKRIIAKHHGPITVSSEWSDSKWLLRSSAVIDFDHVSSLVWKKRNHTKRRCARGARLTFNRLSRFTITWRCIVIVWVLPIVFRSTMNDQRWQFHDIDFFLFVRLSSDYYRR